MSTGPPPTLYHAVGKTAFRLLSLKYLRSVVDTSAGRISVTDAFRIHKTVANSTGAVMNMIGSAIILAIRDDNDRRATLLYCNELRKAIYKRALGRNSNKAINLNIDSGSGQFMDPITSSKATSYIS